MQIQQVLHNHTWRGLSKWDGMSVGCLLLRSMKVYICHILHPRQNTMQALGCSVCAQKWCPGNVTATEQLICETDTHLRLAWWNWAYLPQYQPLLPGVLQVNESFSWYVSLMYVKWQCQSHLLEWNLVYVLSVMTWTMLSDRFSMKALSICSTSASQDNLNHETNTVCVPKWGRHKSLNGKPHEPTTTTTEVTASNTDNGQI